MQINLLKEDILNRLLEVHHLAYRSDVSSIESLVRVIGFHTPHQDTLDIELSSRVPEYSPRETEALFREQDLVRILGLRGEIVTICSSEQNVYRQDLAPIDEQELLFMIGDAQPLITSLGVPPSRLFELIVSLLPTILAGESMTKSLLVQSLAGAVLEHLSSSAQEVWAWPSPIEGQTLGESIVRYFLPVVAHTVLVSLIADPKSAGFLYSLTRRGPEKGGALDQLPLAYRYLHAYGPSDCKDFSHWAGLSQSHAQRLWNRLDASEVVQVSCEDKPAWMLVSDLDHMQSVERPLGIRFISPCDPLLQIPKRSLLIHGKRQHAHFFRSDENRGMVLSDGRCVASWRMKRVKQASTFVVEDIGEPLGRVAVEELEQEAYAIAGAIGTHFGGLSVKEP